MKLIETKICLDCDEVFPETFEICPACAGRTAMPLACWFPPAETTEMHLAKRRLALLGIGAGLSTCWAEAS